MYHQAQNASHIHTLNWPFYSAGHVRSQIVAQRNVVCRPPELASQSCLHLNKVYSVNACQHKHNCCLVVTHTLLPANRTRCIAANRRIADAFVLRAHRLVKSGACLQRYLLVCSHQLPPKEMARLTSPALPLVAATHVVTAY